MDTKFARNVELYCIGIIITSKNSSSIGLKAKAKVGLDKTAVISSMDAKDLIPVSNVSTAEAWTRRNIEEKLIGSISSLRRKAIYGTIASDQPISSNRRV